LSEEEKPSTDTNSGEAKTLSLNNRVTCPECGDTFADKRGLAVHVAHKHRNKKKESSEVKKRRFLAKTKPCPVCGKRIAPQGLPRHIDKHNKEKEAQIGNELTTLIQKPLSDGVKQILEEVPKIADQVLKNEDLLLRALESNGWKVKVKEENMIILTK